MTELEGKYEELSRQYNETKSKVKEGVKIQEKLSTENHNLVLKLRTVENNYKTDINELRNHINVFKDDSKSQLKEMADSITELTMKQVKSKTNNEKPNVKEIEKIYNEMKELQEITESLRKEFKEDQSVYKNFVFKLNPI